MAKLLDFGLVKPTKDEESPVLTREGTVTGSPLYMAPEQVTETHAPDARTDIYAMGAIAYFLLTGRPPFASSDPMAVMVAQARDPVIPPSQYRADVPADLEGVVLRCLEKNPKDRYQDAESLARALAACADSGGWSPEQAEIWWRDNEPLILTGADEPAPPVEIDPADLTHAEDPSPTLEAREVEEVVESVPEGPFDRSSSLGEDHSHRERPR